MAYWQPEGRGGLILPLQPDKFRNEAHARQIKTQDPQVEVFANQIGAATSIDFTTNRCRDIFVQLISTTATLQIQTTIDPATSQWSTITTLSNNAVWSSSNFYPHIRLNLTAADAAYVYLGRRWESGL